MSGSVVERWRVQRGRTARDRSIDRALARPLCALTIELRNKGGGLVFYSLLTKGPLALGV